jgi:hypothetical protein
MAGGLEETTEVKRKTNHETGAAAVVTFIVVRAD